MSPNRRIVLNIIATYGRSVLGAACGIFSTRWVLMALGQEDFGLYGVVGGAILFVSFINIQFSKALGRFYACSIGRANVAKNSPLALEECRRWFATGVAIHTVVPVALVLIGYPIGSWAVTAGVIGIPEIRREACLWLWRFVCISSFVAMVNAPFQAMYVAKQYIAELTIYTTVQVLLRTAFIYYMTLQPGDWLVRYGFAMCLFAIIPEIIICVRALFVFPECRLRFKYLWLFSYMRQIARYATWQAINGAGYLMSSQFLTLIVNRFFGPKVTASYSIGSAVSAETTILNSALEGAFSPAVMTAWGEGNMPRVRSFVYQTCKMGTLLTLLFAIPVSLEVKEVLRIWLEHVPPYTEELCLLMLIKVVVDRLSSGFVIGVNASGRIARYQMTNGLILVSTAPLALFAVMVFRNVYAVMVVLLATVCLANVMNVWLARPILRISLRHWATRIIMPLMLTAIFVCFIGGLVRCVVPPSFVRVVLTTVVTTSALFVASWLFVLSKEERCFVKTRVYIMRKKIIGKWEA